MKKSIFKKLVCLIMVVLIAVLSFPVSAAALSRGYYIDSVNGNDSGLGTELSPWKTTENLKNVSLEAGDGIYFKRGGEYYCELTLTCEGTEELPIRITSYGDASAAPACLYTLHKTEVLRLFDCSYVTVENLEITAPNGGGIWIDAYNKTSVGITLRNLNMHNMPNGKMTSRDNLGAGAAGARACVMVKGLVARSRYAVNDLTITDCEMYDCGNGISVWGSWNDQQDAWCEFEEIDPIFNTGLLIENVFFHDMMAEALVVGMCDGALVTNCRSINCCQDKGVDENGKILFYNAAMWFWGSINSTIEHTEIAGQQMVGDGMTVDFDSYCHNCMYQYVYSHDNTRFVVNNPFYDGHKNNVVRYCLSVNDNRGENNLACRKEGEYGLMFYNNTLVNCSDYYLKNIYNSVIANNIFVMNEGSRFKYKSDDLKHNNDFSNNCIYGQNNPLMDLSAVKCNPGFSGTDYTDVNSFTLSKDSPLIGAGKKIEGAPEKDFFGNEITSDNIGCYGGNGTETEYDRDLFIVRIFRFIKNVFANLFDDISYETNRLYKKFLKWIGMK